MTLALTPPAPAGRPDELLAEARTLGLLWARAEARRRESPSDGAARAATRWCDLFQAALLRLALADRGREGRAVLLAAENLAERSGSSART
jgi:hypothetical protein